MRKQLWIIILLIVWIGQWEHRIIEMSPEPMVTGWGMQSWVEGVSSENRVPILTRLGEDRGERSVWRPAEELRGLVAYQVRVRLPWLFPCANNRSGSHSGDQGGGKGKRFQGGGVEGADSEEYKRGSKGEGESQSGNILEAQRWGLSPEMSLELPERLNSFWQRYYGCFRSKTRNMGRYAYHYLSAFLRMETKRNYTNIGEATGVPGENIQHFVRRTISLCRTRPGRGRWP